MIASNVAFTSPVVIVAVNTPSIAFATASTLLASTFVSERVTLPAPLNTSVLPDNLSKVVLNVTALFTTIFEFAKSPVKVEFAMKLTVPFVGVSSVRIEL